MLTVANLLRAEAIVLTIPRKSILTNKQAGLVLPVALFMLVAATILTLSLVKANMISLRVGGASVVAAETQAASELQLSDFFSRNPIGSGSAAYARSYDGTCTDVGFDCTAITVHGGSTTSAPVAQRLHCDSPPRSSKPWGSETRFNYHLVTTEAANSALGSHAEVAAGVATLLGDPKCPL